MILTEQLLIEYRFEKCINFKSDIYSGEVNLALFSFKKEWFDYDMFYMKILTQLNVT